jgi:hypothetical protein
MSFYEGYRSTKPRASRVIRDETLTACYRTRIHVRSILDGNQFQIVRSKDFPPRVVYLDSKGFSGAFVQNLKTLLAA